MKRNWISRRLTVWTVCIAMVAAMLPLSALAAGDTASAGACGDNLTWSLDGEGTLTISGEGEMALKPPNWGGEWSTETVNTTIKKVVITNGVTNISDNAFWNCAGLTEVSLPETLTSIGAYAFRGCSDLAEIAIPKQVASIGDHAFYACDNLKQITVDADNPVFAATDDVLFNKDQTELIYYFGGETYTVPEGVTSIGPWAFAGCTDLTRVTLSEGVTRIGDYAFNTCMALTECTLPDSLNYIGNGAFYGCASLAAIAIPRNVICVGLDAFRGCASLEAFTVEENPAYVAQEGVLMERCESLGENGRWEPDGTYRLLCYPMARTGAYTVPDGVSVIGQAAFEHCTNLTGVTFPEGLVHIENSAFLGCTGLTGVVIPESVTSIDYAGFWGCDNLAVVVIENENMDIAEDAFFGTAYTDPEGSRENGMWYIGDRLVSADRDITGAYAIRPGTAIIDYHAFYGCGGLTELTIPASVTSIHEGAFMYCNGLTKITVDENNPAFMATDEALFSKDGSQLITYFGNVSYTVPDGVVSIETGAFSGVDMEQIALPDSLTKIGECAFAGCTRLQSLTLPAGVAEIGQDAFGNGENLEAIEVNDANPVFRSIDGVLFQVLPDDTQELVYYPRTKAGAYTLPDGVSRIANNAFLGCGGLTGVTFPDSLKRIGDSAFANSAALMAVSIPARVEYIGSRAFSQCAALADVTIESEQALIGMDAFVNTAYMEEEENWDEDVLYIGKYLIKARDTLSGEYAIKPGTVSIGGAAFVSCHALTGLMIPDSVTQVGSYAFSGADLSGVTLPEALTYIGSAAFKDCARLTAISIPDGVAGLEINTFSGCTALADVTLPQSLTYIGHYAFAGCSSLGEIVIPASVEHMSHSIFLYDKGVTICGEPGSCAEAYAAENNISFKALGAEEPVITPGHVTGGETVSASDALISLLAVTNKIDLTPDQRKAVDVNGNGRIDAEDSLLILQYATEKISQFPVEQAA